MARAGDEEIPRQDDGQEPEDENVAVEQHAWKIRVVI
jgi:hypothetical protein